MIRLGLCCIFLEAPIKFRRTTAAFQAKFRPADRRRRSGKRKKRQLQITIGLALAVVLLAVALLWVMLQ